MAQTSFKMAGKRLPLRPASRDHPWKHTQDNGEFRI